MRRAPSHPGRDALGGNELSNFRPAGDLLLHLVCVLGFFRAATGRPPGATEMGRGKNTMKTSDCDSIESVS
jgi:hypothetical protein